MVMKISQSELVQIVERASTIAERLAGHFIPIASPQSVRAADYRFQRWCESVAPGNLAKFERYLAWEELNFSTVLPVLGDMRLADGQSLPQWTETLKSILRMAASTPYRTWKECNLNKYWSVGTLPFQELFVPFIFVAREGLKKSAISHYHLLAVTSHANLERALLLKLAHLCTQTLEEEFALFLKQKQSSVHQLLNKFWQNPASDVRAFIADLLKGKLLHFWKKYSVLARLVAIAIDVWVESTAEFLQRLAADWETIKQTFSAQTQLGLVTDVQASLADSHNGGRSVIIITFDNRLKLVYKPRDVGLEYAFHQLLDWFNRQRVGLSFKTLQILKRPNYGWVEYVEYSPCLEQQAVRRYYQRAGMLVCLAYVLEATDCHYENLIACGEYPILVDAETLMHPQLRMSENLNQSSDSQHPAPMRLWNSVLRSGLLTRWELSPDGQLACDVSGLGSIVSLKQLKRTSNIALESEEQNNQLRPNVPTLGGIAQFPKDYIEELVGGFQQMYQFLLTHREVLLSGSPLTLFAHQQVRFVFRSTQTYKAVLEITQKPQFLKDGIERSLELERLKSVFVQFDKKPDFWSLLAVEQQALEQMDIPYFTVRADQNALFLTPTQKVEHCFQSSGYASVVARLQNFSQEDLTCIIHEEKNQTKKIRN
jgi:type 2 lantibiotic biosynthesis protein LanM